MFEGGVARREGGEPSLTVGLQPLGMAALLNSRATAPSLTVELLQPSTHILSNP